MEKWEYKTINVEMKGLGEGTTDISNFTMVINQLGNVGWELVSCFTINQEQGHTRAVFATLKRKTNSSLTESADQSSNIQGRTHSYPDKGTRGGAPRTFRKSPGYTENRADHPGKSSNYSEKGNGYKGKSSGYEGKASGYKGKSFGNAEKATGYQGKSSGSAGKGFKPKGRA